MATTFNPQQTIIMANAHDTLKNDDYETGTVTIPGSVAVAAASIALYTQDIVVGASGSLADIRVQTSRDITQDYWAVTTQTFQRSGSLGAYSVFFGAYHINATTMRMQAFASNPYGSPMTGQAGDETFTFKIRTYKAPF